MTNLHDLLTELDKAATPGPWKFRLKNAGNGYIVSEGDDLNRFDICDVYMTTKPQIAHDRAALIVALRNHLSELLLALEAAEELRTENHELRMATEARKDERDSEIELNKDLERRLSEADERVRVLVDAFETYGKHRTGCPFSTVDVCTCGYNEKWNELFPPVLKERP